MKFSNLPCFILLLLCSIEVFADLNTQDYIDSTWSKTYDCPVSADAEKSDQYLQKDDLTKAQITKLQLIKTHNQICLGQHVEAQESLISIVNDQSIDKQSFHYAMAIYQLGFVYDVQEKDERCDLYYRARELSEGKFEDINVSSRLGFLTNCTSSQEFNVRIQQVISLIEEYRNSNNKKLIAHLHNSFALMLASNGFHYLAAEQFLKAHEIGLEVNTSSNQASILVSAIVSLSASDQYDEAKRRLEEFKELNQELDTPLTNFWYHIQKSMIHDRLYEFDELEASLEPLSIHVKRVNNPFYNSLFRYLETSVCTYKKDLICIQKYMGELDAGLVENNGSLRYLEFMVEASLLLGDIERAQQAFDSMNSVYQGRLQTVLKGSRELGITGLYSEIVALEKQVESAERINLWFIASIILFAFVCTLLVFITTKKKKDAHERIDLTTGLLSPIAAFKDIESLQDPQVDKCHALAIFDLANFREVNRLLGATQGHLILKKVTETFKSVTRENDIVARLAPEQFILCLVNIEEDKAHEFFSRTQKALEDKFKIERSGVAITLKSSFTLYTTTEKFSQLQLVIDDMLKALEIEK